MLNFLPSGTDGVRPLGLGIFPLLWVGVLDIDWEPRNPVRRSVRNYSIACITSIAAIIEAARDSPCARRLLVRNSGPTAQIY